MDIKKLLVIFSFLIFLLISPSFAYDNNATDSPISANYGDVYFNSSSLSDGDGSIENPYNKITMDRINNYATLHLADGEYNVTCFKTISSLNIVGESYDNTIIRHDGLLFTVLSELSLNNLTLSGVTIKNQGIVNSTNVIFSDAIGSSSDRYNNVFGGVFDNYGTNYVKPKLYLDNCIFKNNYAEYGGAIYLINGEAFINSCLFERNIAYNYGGAIACDGSSKLTIKNTRFKFDSSTNDAGGALYLKDSSIIIENSNFTNCNSLFGGAICDLNSDLSIDNAVFSSNDAVYDGGAIFKMYGDLSVLNSKFNFNAANNGGAIFTDNSSSFVVKSSRFSSNTAKYCGGVIYSLLNKNSVIESNIYTRNKANSYPNVFETDLVNLFIGNNNNYSMFKYNTSLNELPSRYSSVDEGFVTPVKDQQTSGNCWAFTAIATLESCILKASNITYDLSEENMKNLIELYSDYGWNMVTNRGGYDNMAIGYFASWLGPILEENDSFDDYSTLSPVLDSIMHVQNVIFLGRDNFTDNNRIKEAIFKYGAVGTGLYYSGSYLFGDSYYYSGSASENHAVTIVGWDDDYPYYKFGNPAPANGAWIVKNSWDDDWSDRGYFYMSYYDSRFARVGNDLSSYTFILNDTLRYDKNYQYDIIGLTKFISSTNEIWYENIFNSTDDEVLAAFSTYFTSKSNWTSYVYVNDELLLIQNGTSLPGYYTFDFNDYIYLNKGDSFKIVVKLANDGFASVPVSERTYSNKIFYKEGVSFFSYDGVEWYDLYNFAGSQVACMKAFTIIPSVLLEINGIGEYCVNDLFNITSIISDNSVNGSVIYNIDGNLFTVNVTDGFATLPISFNKSGIYDCSAYFVGEGKFSNKVDFTVNIKNIILNTTILLDNVTSFVGEVIVLNASVFDENGDLVSNGNVTWVVGDDSFVCPVVNGSAFKEVSFDKAGNYNVVASFNGMNYNPSSRTAYIVINKLKLSSNITVNSSFINTGDEINIISNVISDNLTVNDGVAVFLINKTKRYVVNISDNQAILDVIFNQSGNYIVDVSFDHEKYEIDNCSVIVNVFDKFSRISISDLKAYVGDKCNISVLVFDAKGNMIDTGILNIIINDKIYSIDLSKDYPLLEILFNKSGLYNVFAEFDAFGYQKSFNSSVIEVCKKDLEVNFKIDDIYYGEDLTINVQSNDDADVEIIINNLTYHLKTNTEFIIKNTLNAGKYESILYFNGDEKYNSLNKTANFNVNKRQLSAEFKVENKTFFIYLSQSINDTLLVKINNQDYVIYLTNGEAKLTLDNFDVGSYLAVVNYANPNYEEIHENYSFEIPKIKTKILVNNLVKYYKNASRYELTLIDENGNYLANKSVIISISGVNYTRITDEKGKASIGINLNSGTYAPVVYFEGDGEFNSSKNSSMVIVKSTIEANNLVKCYRNASQFYATILDYNGNIVKNQVISFNINGVFYNRTTNENGVVKLNINLSPGEYIITTLNLVTGESASNNITVLSLIVENKNLVKYYRNASQYCVKILDDQGNPVGAGVTVRFNINGVFYERQTNESGIVKLNINLNPGEYIITAEYKGCCVSNEITIKPILTANDLTKRYGDSDQFVATLVDGQGKAYAGQYVEFNINGVFYKRLTDDNGQAKLNIRLMPGLYIITSSFGGFSTSNAVKIV